MPQGRAPGGGGGVEDDQHICAYLDHHDDSQAVR